MLKGPKRSFVVLCVVVVALILVLVLLGMESSSKNVTKVTKNVRKQNLLQSDKKMLHSEQNVFVNKNS